MKQKQWDHSNALLPFLFLPPLRPIVAQTLKKRHHIPEWLLFSLFSLSLSVVLFFTVFLHYLTIARSRTFPPFHTESCSGSQCAKSHEEWLRTVQMPTPNDSAALCTFWRKIIWTQMYIFHEIKNSEMNTPSISKSTSIRTVICHVDVIKCASVWFSEWYEVWSKHPPSLWYLKSWYEWVVVLRIMIFINWCLILRFIWHSPCQLLWKTGPLCKEMNEQGIISFLLAGSATFCSLSLTRT